MTIGKPKKEEEIPGGHANVQEIFIPKKYVKYDVDKNGTTPYISLCNSFFH